MCIVACNGRNTCTCCFCFPVLFFLFLCSFVCFASEMYSIKCNRMSSHSTMLLIHSILLLSIQPKLSLQYKIINSANLKKISQNRYWLSLSYIGLVFFILAEFMILYLRNNRTNTVIFNLSRTVCTLHLVAVPFTSFGNFELVLNYLFLNEIF